MKILLASVNRYCTRRTTDVLTFAGMVKPRHTKVPRDWQNKFVVRRLCNIEDLFHIIIFFTITEAKNEFLLHASGMASVNSNMCSHFKSE